MDRFFISAWCCGLVSPNKHGLATLANIHDLVIVGTSLKLLFSRTTPAFVYILALCIEGWGIGFVLQPGQYP